MIANLATVQQNPLKIGDILGDGSCFAGISPDFNDKVLIVAATDGPTPMSWENSLKYAASLKAHGHADWRLPTPAELDILYKNRHEIGNFAMTAAPYNDEFHSKMHYWALLRPELVLSWQKQFDRISSPRKVNTLMTAWLKANQSDWGTIYGAPSQSFSSGAKDPDYCMVNRFSIRCVRTAPKNKFTF